MRVMQTRRSLGMKLHTIDWFVFRPQAFERAIIERKMRDLNFILIQRFGQHHVVVILRGHINFLIPQILHGMIPTVMAKFESSSLSA